MTNFIQQNKSSLVQSALASGVFVGADKAIYGTPMDWKRAGLSFVSNYLSDMGVSYVQPTVAGISPTLAESRFLEPVLSGLFYVIGDRMFYYDMRGWMIPFLLQAGSSAVAEYITPPVLSMF